MIFTSAINAARGRLASSYPSALVSVRRAQLHLDLQRVPVVRRPGHAAVCVPEDGQPLHRQSGAVGRGELHLCGHQHGHQDQRAGAADASGAAGRRYGHTRNWLWTHTRFGSAHTLAPFQSLIKMNRICLNLLFKSHSVSANGRRWKSVIATFATDSGNVAFTDFFDFFWNSTGGIRAANSNGRRRKKSF